MRVVGEPWVRSKTGQSGDCEDAVAVNHDFACVIDGATSSDGQLWNGQRPGRAAAEIIRRTVTTLPARSHAFEAVDILTGAIAAVYRRKGKLSAVRDAPSRRMAASVAIYSRFRREVWIVGDCQALIVHRDERTTRITNPKRVDAVVAEARALFLAAEQKRGVGVEQLRSRDPGRAFIEPLLRQQRYYQNDSERGEYSYWVVDGFPVARFGIKTVPLPDDAVEVVLATDGYPKLFRTLEKSEDYLRRLIRRDPLVIGKYRTAKGVLIGGESYDDRTFLRIDLGPRSRS